MQQYLDSLNDIMMLGLDRPNRTGVATRGLFGVTYRFHMGEGFPIITTKKIPFQSVVGELLGFIRGYTNAGDFRALGCNIWDANANENKQWLDNPYREGEDDLGRIYGAQWREWITTEDTIIDQLAQAINTIKTNPTSRRIIVTAWNPAELDQMALPPCHIFYQFNVREHLLDLLMYQRSCDMFLGVPFNISSYALLLCMVAQVTGKTPGDFVHVLGDAHIYHNHFAQVREQLTRKPYPLPTLFLNPDIKEIDDFDASDIKLLEYGYHNAIKAPMAV